MDPIPNEREDVAHYAADEERDDNQRGRSNKIKRPNVNRSWIMCAHRMKS